jgi:glycosyltransferase involved in cell wall biosynthesis
VTGERPRIVIVGDGAAPTGFARVLENVFTRLEGMYDIHQLAINYQGDPHDWSWKLYPAGAAGDLRGVNRLPRIVRAIDPAFVFLLNDIWTLGVYVKTLRQEGLDVPTIAYCPIESGPVDPSHVRDLEGVTRFVVYTDFARREVARAVHQLHEHHPPFDFPVVEIIGHGVDTDRFQPYPVDGAGDDVKRRAKALLFGDDEDLIDSFIVLNANRNQARKRIDTTVKGFALFARDKPQNVRLYLHMGIEDLGWDVIRLARRYEIENRLIMTSHANTIPAVSDAELNLIYNACDVGINTAATEGWGLVSFEHGATRTAQIVPGHSCCYELWEGAAEMLDAEFSLTAPMTLLEEKLITPEEVARKLQKLYDDPVLRSHLAGAAYDRARDQAYRWDSIASQWNLLFQDVIARRNSIHTQGSPTHSRRVTA